MDGTPTIDIEQLVREIRLYLAAVDTFRAAGCRLAWRGEPSAQTLAVERRR